MLKTNSTPATHSLNISNVLLSAKWQKVGETSWGYVFTPDKFASDWDNIYLQPSNLKIEDVTKGMRRLVTPTLLISSEKSKMAYVLASKDKPVYIQSEYTKDKNFGYLMAFTISPEVTPEYMFYACKFNLWSKLLSRIGAHDYSPSWNHVGIVVSDPIRGSLQNSPEDIVRSLGEISIHTITKQKELVKAAKEQEAVVEHHRYEVADLVERYTRSTGQLRIFNKYGVGLLAETYRIAAGTHVKSEVVDILNEYEFKKDILSQEELHFLSKNLKELFKHIISFDGITFLPSEAFIQPQEVTDFMCKIASFPENVIVYNPFAGANSYATTLPNHIVGEELNRTSWALGQIWLFANYADKRADIALGDSFSTMASNKKYSAIISSPAYLVEEGHEISDIVRLLYDKLEDGGKLVCIVSANFLFRKDKKVRSVREDLIKNKALSSVIMLPPNIFIGTGVSQAALVVTKGMPNNKIIFADASGYTRFAKSVYRATTFDVDQFLEDLKDDVDDYYDRGCTIEETVIAAPIEYSEIVDSDLTPVRYLTPKPYDGVALSELATEVKELTGKEMSADYFLTGSSIPAAMHRKPFVPTKAEDDKVSASKRYVKVPENAVILTIVSGNIRTVYTEDFTGKIAFPDGLMKVLQPIEGISAKYMAALLSTKIVADQIMAQTVGLTIPRLNKLDLSHIIVPIHNTVEEREQLIAEVLSSEMSDLEEELQETLDSQKREVRSTRHAMIQTLSSLSSKWERLKRFAKAKEGTIHLSDMIGRINPTTVEEFMGGIEYAIDTLRRQVESFRLEKKDWGEPEDINPYEFIETYKATHFSTDFAMLNLGNDNKADIPYFTGENDEEHTAHTDALFTFRAPRALVERIFDNIVSNAKSHGFTSDIANPTIQFDWQTNGGRIEITIKNNGIPLKEGVSGADVLMSDFSTALKQKANDGSLHFGIGGFEIKSLMEGLGAVEVISQPDAEYPVIYKLTFNDVSFQEVNLFDN